jgi:hypothetical protein
MFLFDNQDMDLAFLRQEVVRCTATFSNKQAEAPKRGDKIVVQLSNRKKFMGIVTDSHLTMVNDILQGYFDIKKA